jgi:hypothetical protein
MAAGAHFLEVAAGPAIVYNMQTLCRSLAEEETKTMRHSTLSALALALVAGSDRLADPRRAEEAAAMDPLADWPSHMPPMI